MKCIYWECCGINNKQRSLRSQQLWYSECRSDNFFYFCYLMLEIQSFLVMDGLGKEETCSVVVISHTSQQSLQADMVPFYRQGNLCIRIEREFPSRVIEFTRGKESHHSDQICLPWKSIFKKHILFLFLFSHSGFLIVEVSTRFLKFPSEMMTGF